MAYWLGSAAVALHQLIVDDENKLRGIITRGDLVKALREDLTDHTVLESGTTELFVTYPHETVHEALSRMLLNDIGRLPVVAPDDPTQIIGYLSRANVMATHMKQLKEESDIESGWVQSRVSQLIRNGTRPKVN